MVLRDIAAQCSVQVAPSVSELRAVTVPAGEVLVVDYEDRHDDSPAIFVRPHRYQALEADFVEPASRLSPGYRGYYLELQRDDLTEHCKVLDQRA